MGFSSSNRYFIQNELVNKMRRLSSEERQSSYALIRNQTRSRIKRAYQEATEKAEFYYDTMLCLKEFELPYLAYNLLFEEELLAIIEQIKTAYGALPTDTATVNSMTGRFILLVENSPHLSDNQLRSFFKSEVLNTVEDISELDWANEEEHEHPVVKKVANYLVSNNDATPQQMLELLIIYSKMWNYYPSFYYPFNNTKAIILLNSFNQVISRNHRHFNKIKFVSMMKLAKTSLGDLFVKGVYLPLLDKESNPEYVNGYLNQRELFNKHLHELIVEQEISVDSPFQNLLDYTISYPALEQLILEVVTKKIASFQYPDDDLLELLENSSNSVKETINRHLYRY